MRGLWVSMHVEMLVWDIYYYRFTYVWIDHTHTHTQRVRIFADESDFREEECGWVRDAFWQDRHITSHIFMLCVQWYYAFSKLKIFSICVLLLLLLLSNSFQLFGYSFVCLLCLLMRAWERSVHGWVVFDGFCITHERAHNSCLIGHIAVSNICVLLVAADCRDQWAIANCRNCGACVALASIMPALSEPNLAIPRLTADQRQIKSNGTGDSHINNNKLIYVNLSGLETNHRECRLKSSSQAMTAKLSQNSIDHQLMFWSARYSLPHISSGIFSAEVEWDKRYIRIYVAAERSFIWRRRAQY